MKTGDHLREDYLAGRYIYGGTASGSGPLHSVQKRGKGVVSWHWTREEAEAKAEELNATEEQPHKPLRM